MLRENVRVGRVAENLRAELATEMQLAFGKRMEFEPLLSQPGFCAVIAPEVRRKEFVSKAESFVRGFNAGARA